MSNLTQNHNSSNKLSPLALKELVTSYFGLVKVIANAIAVKNTRVSALTSDDIFQFGVIGLLDAIERFDAHRGVKFETFAGYRIKGAILDGLRSADIVPRSARKKQRDLDQAYESAGGLNPSHISSQKLKMPIKQYHSFLHDVEGTTMSHSVYSEVSEGVLEALPDDDTNNPFEIVSSQQTRELLVEAIEHLPERERLVVLLYYYEGLTFREIGKVINLSESRVFQLHSSAINVLHTALQETVE